MSSCMPLSRVSTSPSSGAPPAFPLFRKTAGCAAAPARLVGEHASMQQLRALVGKIAPVDSTVLITGESGTGKNVVARMIHLQSKRARGPFVTIDCGAIPNDLLESELFGHERGAFTGALAARTGLFLLGNRGTIFLDDVTTMSPALQVKVLRVLQDHEIQPVGAGRCTRVDMRVVAASNQDLAQEVAAGRFREDLYYRLNVLPVSVPALRERRSDVPLLVAHFLDTHNRRHRSEPVRISDEAMVRLVQYDWPGNVRQLANVVERVVILSESGVVQACDLPVGPRSLIARTDLPWGDLDEGGFDLLAAVGRFENRLIDNALSRTRGDRQAAARLLGVKRTTLVARLARRKQLGSPASEDPPGRISASSGGCLPA